MSSCGWLGRSNNPHAHCFRSGWHPYRRPAKDTAPACPLELDIGTLIECARTKKQEQLLAISRRKTLPDKLTDILVERGDQQVVLSTAKNASSRFSDKGFNTLIKRAHGDDALTSCVAMRSDLPEQLFD
jgi:hypothetical protein